MIPNEGSYGKAGTIGWLNRLMVPLIVVLIAVAAFGLGRLSALDTQKGNLVIHPANEASSGQGTTSQITVH